MQVGMYAPRTVLGLGSPTGDTPLPRPGGERLPGGEDVYHMIKSTTQKGTVFVGRIQHQDHKSNLKELEDQTGHRTVACCVK